MSSDLWDSRFKATEYVYGVEPNVFFREELLKLKPGSLLLPAEGEGRNAVFAASKGWDVDAFDWSAEAQIKALNLAKKNNVILNYQVSTFDKFSTEKKYQAIGLIFIHLPEEERIAFHKKVSELLADDGTLILFAYTKSQLALNTGGPRELGLLYSLEDVISDFIELDFIQLSQELVELQEGRLHNGQSDVIKFVGRKTIS